MAKIKKTKSNVSPDSQQKSQVKKRKIVHTVRTQDTSSLEADAREDISSPLEESKGLEPSANALSETISLDIRAQKKISKHSRTVKKQLKNGIITINAKGKELKKKAEEGRGLVYIGHIPHGFYEEEMKQYFKQFGVVTNVKVCRSKKTGNSKGYGFIEFKNPEVAKIAADTMNNYLMFQKRIVTEYVPPEKRPKCIFYGKSSSAQHTSVMSRRGKQKFSRNKTLDDTTAMKKIRTSRKRINSKMEKLKKLGVQCKLVPVSNTGR